MQTETTIAATPEDVGVDSAKLQAVFDRAEQDVSDGKLPSAQVAIARNGQLAGFRTFGTAVQGGEERPATDDTLYSIFSSTKGIVAAGVWALFEEDLLALDERISDIIPEFATNEKKNITVEQTMLHIGGFPMAPFRAEDWDNRPRRSERFSQWRLNWEPGSQFEYHATSAHWVLVEIIERRTGKDFRTYLRERILDPMGLEDLHIGLPPELDKRVADIVYVEPPEAPPGGFGEVTPEALLNFNKREIRSIGVPGGGGIARAAELALFYGTLANGGTTGSGTQVLKPETIEFATKPRTQDHHREPLFDVPVNRALAVVVAGDDGLSHTRGFGRSASARAFGHGGAGGQIAWGDPETGLSVGYCTNGFASVEAIRSRGVAISSLAGDCALS